MFGWIDTDGDGVPEINDQTPYGIIPINMPHITGNAGVAGATLNYTGGVWTADITGAYSFPVPYNWSGTVTPSKAGYQFSPVSRSYTNVLTDQTVQNYVATPSLALYVKADG